MANMDEWGSDPSVVHMRKVFKGMETSQEAFLKRLGILPFDLRVRRWRERALIIFERIWGVSVRMGINMNEERAASVYVHCLSGIMNSDGIDVPEELLPDIHEMEEILKEVFG